MVTLNLSLPFKTLTSVLYFPAYSSLSFTPCSPPFPTKSRSPSFRAVKVKALVDGEYSSKRSNIGEERETIRLPGCDYNHWLIVMEFPKDPAPTRDQMIDTCLNTFASVLGSMEEAKKNMYAFSTTTCTEFRGNIRENQGLTWCFMGLARFVYRC
ncbi:hypothetical protein CASFOL_028958 [Castilleja foliolosa]|uniref:MORF/ORRM1/DAG-like MORF domain-containing protein n=1 Tax=Castilleja foliolosa TaxID=1961234 RepID=A0ABD3CFQ0_9LAMI